MALPDEVTLEQLIDQFLAGFDQAEVSRRYALTIAASSAFAPMLVKQLEGVVGELPPPTKRQVATLGMFAAIVPSADQFESLDEVLSPESKLAIERMMISTVGPGPWPLVTATPFGALSELAVRTKAVVEVAGYPVTDDTLASIPTWLVGSASLAKATARAWRKEGEAGLPGLVSELADYLQRGANTTNSAQTELERMRSSPDPSRHSSAPRRGASPQEMLANVHEERRVRSRNPFPIAGLALGIVSVPFYFLGILPILAVVLSGIGLAKNGTYHGRGKVQSSIGLALGAIYTLMYLRFYGHLG